PANMSAGATFGRYVASSLAARAACAHNVAQIKRTEPSVRPAKRPLRAAKGLQTTEHLNAERRVRCRARIPSGFESGYWVVAADSPRKGHGLSQRKLTPREVVYLVMRAELAFALDQTVGRWIMPLLRTSLLRAEPTGTLRSLDELFALANAME